MATNHTIFLAISEGLASGVGHVGLNPKGNPMSRIPTPATIEAAPAASRPLLEAVKKQLGVVPEPVPPRRQQPGRARRLSRPFRRLE